MLEKYPKGIFRGLNHEKGSLMKRLNAPRTTLFDNLTKLQKMGIVMKYSMNNGNRGRPKEYWKIKNGGNSK